MKNYLTVVVVVLGALANYVASAQELSPQEINDIFKRVEPWMVQLEVKGKLDGRDKEPQLGTGIIFYQAEGATARILTAAHVAGYNNQFDPDPTYARKVLRDVWVRKRLENGSVRFDAPFHWADANDANDIAQIYFDGESANAPRLSAAIPQIGQSVIAISWQTGLQRPTFTVMQVLPHQSDDGNMMRLEKPLPESASGSPILDSSGNIVAIAISVVREGPNIERLLAMPVREFQGWVTGGVLQPVAPKNPVAVVQPPLLAAVTQTVTSGDMPSGPSSQWSNFYTLCSQPLPADKKIISSEFFLQGDRSCGAWAECRKSEESPSRVCWQFRMQGHNEAIALFQNAGIRSSRGVLKYTFQ